MDQKIHELDELQQREDFFTTKKFIVLGTTRDSKSKFIEYCLQEKDGRARRYQDEHDITVIEDVGAIYNAPELYASDESEGGDITEIANAFFIQNLIKRSNNTRFVIILPYFYTTYLGGRKIFKLLHALVETFNLDETALQEIFSSSMLILTMEPHIIQTTQGLRSELLALSKTEILVRSYGQRTQRYLVHLCEHNHIDYLRDGEDVVFRHGNILPIMQSLTAFDGRQYRLKSLCIDYHARRFLQRSIKRVCDNYRRVHNRIDRDDLIRVNTWLQDDKLFAYPLVAEWFLSYCAQSLSTLTWHQKVVNVLGKNWQWMATGAIVLILLPLVMRNMPHKDQ